MHLFGNIYRDRTSPNLKSQNQEKNMKKLIFALQKANLEDGDLDSILTELENLIEFKISNREQILMKDTISPIQSNTSGIRSDLQILAETMRLGFENMNERFLRIEDRFLRMDEKIDFTRINLERQIISTRENLERQIEFNRVSSKQELASTKENLEIQMRSLEKQLNLLQRLTWIVLTLVLGLFAKAIHLF